MIAEHRLRPPDRSRTQRAGFEPSAPAVTAPDPRRPLGPPRLGPRPVRSARPDSDLAIRLGPRAVAGDGCYGPWPVLR
jgi:hypothetical protein